MRKEIAYLEGRSGEIERKNRELMAQVETLKERLNEQ